MAARENIIEVSLSKPQAAILNCRAAVILNMAGQGAGKTSVIGYSTGMLIEMFPELAGFLGANTYGQLSSSTLKGVFREWKRVFGWTEYHVKSNPSGDFVVDKVPPLHFERFEHFKDYNNIISFRSGAIVFLGSLDKYKAHDGKEFAWAHLDETKDTKEEALTEVIFGRLRQMGLWFDKEGNMVGGKYSAEEAEKRGLTAWNPCYIHTSPAVAIVQWINEMFQLNPYEEEIRKRVLQKDKDFWSREWAGKAAFIYSTFHNKKFLPPNFIELQLARLTASRAEKLIYGLPFSKSGAEYYPYFERTKHVRPLKFTPGLNVHQTWDFNVVPYMTMLCAQIQFVMKYRDLIGNKFPEWEEGLQEIEVMEIRFYREYCMKSPFNSTEAVCDFWRRDHEKEDPNIFFYGDASGKNRIPGLGSLTNFKIIKDALSRYVHNSSDRVRVPNVNPLTRRDLVNDIMAGKYPDVEVIFDEEMVNTVKDFETVKLGKDGKIKKRVKDPETGESYESVGHTSDCVDYILAEVCREYMLRNKN